MRTAAQQWAEALHQWHIPDEILDQAPANPWIHPPKMFASSNDDPSGTASMRAAADLLGEGGSVLDVGCGGGRSSLPLAARITEIAGVDEQQAMLDQFVTAAAERGVPCRAVLGRWPAVAGRTPTVDVVVCHHVVYNVAAIGEFVGALTGHASRGVVVELPETHPTSSFNGLWKRFWNLDRPTEPTADLFVDVVRESGAEPTVIRQHRQPRRSKLDPGEFTAFVRQRLCLSPHRDPEIAEALADNHDFDPGPIVTVTWRV